MADMLAVREEYQFQINERQSPANGTLPQFL